MLDTGDDTLAYLAELAELAPDDPAWAAWAAANPALAEEALVARRVRALLREFEDAAVAVPEGFEARLMARLREDRTLLDLLDLSVLGLGGVVLELLGALLGLLPQAQPAAA